MPIIEAGKPELQELRGIHLWHAGLSSCSQRVRLALAELQLEFTSHIVDLHAGENASAAYQQINPKGVVPALVHDGTVLIESVDIIAYLDEQLGHNALRPVAQEDEIARLLPEADAAQPALKVCTFEFLFRAAPPAPQAVLDRYQQTQQNESLREFHREFRDGFKAERIGAAVNYTHAAFAALNTLCGDGRPWLAGSEFSLADIAWMPNFHRFDLIGWPFERYPDLRRWFAAASARPSYRKALTDWESQGLLDAVLPKIAARRSAGRGIETIACLAGQA